ncbi:hypothetical protein [Leptospira noguchii]|uniref:Nucleotidyltransferase family protein n=1 Tax=Leptospira noguchii TaxID=28182 RepID=A0AAE9KCE0_9LEPT|nr:hypothetical protein [Leptospira noguchii]UOG32652.1 hypothetical protein MAL06_20515 [Leptospira noguchii]UOG47215.1 hypothetical protein MAL01_19465 [Leptospira noguchii]UOG50930.1 hypothetical protein MAL00_19785 [Leptospira noguchii]UOG58787.1 hypothetical protein MAL03_20315 [Leptospira noguchii]UOG62570.1 hypothetical protein MAL07_19430 [Leptospira noguchii]
MDEPDWKSVNEEELWKYVGWHLAEKGIQSVLVGGAVVSIYSKGAYRSGDIDLVEPIVSRSKEIALVMENIGFRKTRRHYVHPKCKHLYIEFLSGPVSIGEDFKIVPDEKKFKGKILKIFSPTDCIKDRLASYIHFKARECLDQALLVAKNQRFDLRQIKEWCFREGEIGKSAFEEFQALL